MGTQAIFAQSGFEGYALSPQQKRVWDLMQWESHYLAQVHVSVKGEVDVQRLATAFRRVMLRHEILRSRFDRLSGVYAPVQVVMPESGVLFEEMDLRSASEELQREEVERVAALMRDRQRNLPNGCPLQVHWLRCSDDSAILLAGLPALCADAGTLARLVNEARLLSTGVELDEPVSYTQFSAWQNELLQDSIASGGQRLWERTRQAAGTAALTLPLEDSVGADGDAPHKFQYHLGAVLTQSILELAQKSQSTVEQVLLSAWMALLSRLTGASGIVVGTLFDPRADSGSELDGLLGPCSRYLPVMVHLDTERSWRDLLANVGYAIADAREGADAFSWDLFDVNGAEGAPAFLPFAFEYAAPFQPVAANGARFHIVSLEACHDYFRLRLSCVHALDGLLLRFHYAPHRFAESAIHYLADAFETLLAGAVANSEKPIEEFDLAGPVQRRDLLIEFNATTETVPFIPVHRSFERVARRLPEQAAIVSGDAVVPFAELDARANRLASWLRSNGIGPESRVGICLHPSPELIVSLLAVLKAGGAYVPVNPAYPVERICFMTAGILVLASAETASALPEGSRTALVENLLEAGDPHELPHEHGGPDRENLAYVIYTSGSTGEPKGVLVTQAGLANYIEWALGHYSFGQGGNGAPLHSSIAFDLTVTTIFGPLLSGEPVHIAPSGAGPEALVGLMRSAPDFTFVKLTPSHLRLLNQQLTAEQASKAARGLILGGEALLSEHVAFWASAAPEVMLFNEYGPTETVVGCCCYATPAGNVEQGAIPIGRPIRNTRLYVLDGELNPVAAGLPGELFIGGMGVARGYFDRPDLTAERFIADAFSEEPGSRLYRTGDLVRFLRNGSLEYMGRIDDQIKIRGYRIEPGEIEAALIAHGGVRVAVVIADEPQPGERRLVAYFVSSGTEAVAIVELRRFLETRLPDYMVPAIYIQLTALPLTPNGKVDRLNLPAPGQSRAQFENAFVIPLTIEEEVLAGVWSQVLKVQDVGADDNYFALGGDSIRSIQIVARAQERGLHFSVDDLFKNPTIRGLAKVLHGADNSDTSAAPAFSMISAVDRERIPAGIDDAYPLTQLQAGMIFHREYRPGSAIYHDISSFYVRAPFDPAKLQIAVNAMGARHEALRTSFDMVSYSQPLQLVHRYCDFGFRLVDISDWTLPQQEAKVDRFYEQEKTQGFDFARSPLLRIWIHLRGPGAWQFTLSFHHAILDGWSEASLITEMFHHYLALVREETIEVNPPVTRFRDYVALEQTAMASEEAADFWTEKLRDAVALELPRWRQPIPGPPTRREILVHEVPLAQEVSDGLKRLALSTAVPVKDVLLAAHLRVLALLCGNTDVLTCVVSAGRPETMDGERVAGLFINSIPFRVGLGGGSWSDLVTEVFDAERELLPYRRFPMAEIRRRLGGQPLSETLFYFTHYHVYQSVQRIPEVTLLGARLYEETSFTMASNFRLDAFTGGVAFILKCDGSVLGIEQVHAIADCYLRCLTAMALSPLARYENFSLLSEAESREILETSHGNARDYSGPVCIHEWIEQQADLQPKSEAVRAEAGVLSYAELDGLANQVAHALRSQGVGAEVRVGVCLERGLEMVVALLGVLKAGGAYVPMEPGYPAERLAWIAEDAGIKVVISQRKWEERLGNERGRVWLDGWEEIAGQPKTRVKEKLAGDNLAYVIYTSGSTGRPKGAMNTHRGIRNRLLWMQEYFGLESKDVVLQKTPFSFDVSVWEFFWPLMAGARLVMARPGGHQDSGYLVEAIEKEQVSTVHFVPSMLDVFLEEEEAGARCGSLQRVICSGEAMSRGLQERFEQRLGCGLYNLYGPTEASVDVTVWNCERGTKETVVPIGRPIANTEVYVVDEYGDPTPVGTAGEVYLGGEGLGRGYLGRADWTAERWVPDSLSGAEGARLYRTGDVGRRRADGAVEYIGRGDQQVKLRGFRIELGEIEEALRGCAGVREAVVAVKTEGGDARLVGYVVGEKELGLGELRVELQRRLPEYMVPSAMMRLESLPLSANGKLDRKALPTPDAGQLQLDQPYDAPRDTVEIELCRMWEEALRVPGIGIHQNFFELGGYSLMAVSLVNKIRRRFSVRMAVATIFEAPTVAQLAIRIRNAAEHEHRLLLPYRTKGTRPPFFCVHAASGTVLAYAPLARHLSGDQPFYGIQAQGVEGEAEPLTTVHEMAARYLPEVRATQPHGPYSLGGWSLGGHIALEMARTLAAEGETISMVALFDAIVPLGFDWEARHGARDARLILAALLGRLSEADPPPNLNQLSTDEQLELVIEAGRRLGRVPPDFGIDEVRTQLRVLNINLNADLQYRPEPYSGRVVLFRASDAIGFPCDDPDGGWREFAPALETCLLPGDHYSMLLDPANALVAACELDVRLAQVAAALHGKADSAAMSSS
jgi:amino acid adenylation domain-containing protein